MIFVVRVATEAVDAARIAFEAFGVRVQISVSPPDGIARMRSLLPPGWRPCPSSNVQKRFAIRPDAAGNYVLFRDERPFISHLDIDLAFELLEAQVRAYIALHAPDRIFVHAGVVAYGGHAMVIPGLSFSGKTTLVAALIRAGATYYSDEYAPLDEHGRVHPYPKPLSLRDHRQVQHDHDIESLGGVAGEQPLPIRLVVATTYSPGALWAPRRLSAGEGVLALLSHTVPAQTRAEQVMRYLTRSVPGATLIESPRGEADELAPLLLSALQRSGPINPG